MKYKTGKFALVNLDAYTVTGGRQISLAPRTGSSPGRRYYQFTDKQGAVLLVPVDVFPAGAPTEI